MAMIRCKADLHFYDPNKCDSCPYCQDLRGREGSAQALDESAVADICIADTVKEDSKKIELPAAHNRSKAGHAAVQRLKESAPAGSPDEPSPPAEPLNAGPKVNLSETTMTPTEECEAFEPVVGWLVCMDGPERGKDYHIKTGTNEIAREVDPEVDIVIRGDQMISRRYHAEIQYDPEDNEFYLIQKKNEAVKLNDAKVKRPTKLNPYDILQLGETRLVFVPLCSEKFQWTTSQ